MKDALQRKIDFKTKPQGSLGQLEDIALQIGELQNTLSPQLSQPTILVFAADHGLANAGVSLYPKEVTYQMVMNFVQGGAAINVFCRQHNIALKVVDAGVDFKFPADAPIINAKIGLGTQNMLHGPAMTTVQCEDALEKGRELVKAEYEAGCNIIGFGEMGIGNTSAATLLLHHFTGLSIDEATGAGTGQQGEGLKHKKTILNQVALKYKPQNTIEALSTFGGFEIAMMCGAVLEAARLNMVVLVDGFIATSAFLCAYKLNKRVKDNAIFCHNSNEKAHRAMLDYVGAKPILDLGLRLGEGTGAALAYPLVASAVAFLNEMASFETAGVSTSETDKVPS